MGGVVSTGRDNDDLVDNLKEAEYIKSEDVEFVFRIVDRAHYYLEECRESAYKDLAWKNGTLHLSAPCIYSEVMEALELKKGMSFLNLGSGTGYLNTMVGYMIGPFGINHGIELHASNITYAEERLKELKVVGGQYDDLELCEPVFVEGNCLNLAPDNRRYDRVYCGAACPTELISTVQNLIKVQGILVVPVGDQLLKIKRLSETDFTSDNVLPVSFASLVEPSAPKDVQELIMLPEVNPLSLQDICRITIREAVRQTYKFNKHPPKNPFPPKKQSKKLLPSPRLFGHERGRYPLNILPTTQGLMIMGAFTDESDDSDDSENIDGMFLDQQLQQHARERRQMLDTADVDSNLSDDEYKSDDGLAGEGRSRREKLESMESEDGVVADDEDGGDDEMDTKEVFTGKKSEKEEDDSESEDDDTEEDPEEIARRPRCFLPDAVSKQFTIQQQMPNGTTKRLRVHAIEKRTWVESRPIPQAPAVKDNSLSSDDEAIVAEPSASSSQAIEMNVLASNARTSKTSYSTSAETSETSGFGSLGDDQVHIGSVHSGISNLEDDVIDDKSDRPSVHNCMLTNSPENKLNLKKPALLDEFSHPSDSSDDDVETTNDEDHDDEGAEMDSDVDYVGYTKSPGELSTDYSGGNSDNFPFTFDKTEECEIIRYTTDGFTLFLKNKVESLPIPRSMKKYICHFR